MNGISAQQQYDRAASAAVGLIRRVSAQALDYRVAATLGHARVARVGAATRGALKSAVQELKRRQLGRMP